MRAQLELPGASRRAGAPLPHLLLAAALVATCTGSAPAQAAPDEAVDFGGSDVTEPVHGTEGVEVWEVARSVGQPPRWSRFAAVGVGAESSGSGPVPGTTAAFGVHRSLLRPRLGILGYSAAAYVGHRGGRLDGGLRAQMGSPAVYLHAGVDWNARLGRADLLLTTQFPLARGGWPVRAAEVRLDWVPARGHALTLGAALPLGRPLAGRTRPRTTGVYLPPPPAFTPAPPPAPGTAAAAALAEARRSLGWLLALNNLHWFADRSSLAHDKTVVRSRARLADLREALAEREARLGAPRTYRREVEGYHAALETAFASALGEEANGHPRRDAAARGRKLAEEARRAALEELVLPYNRTIGRHRRPDTLLGLVVAARERFARSAPHRHELDVAETSAVLGVLDAWLGSLEDVHRRMAERAPDSRTHWIPLALALRPEEHDTQEKVDALMERALGSPFSSGNEVLYIDALQLQEEVDRTIHETERYHLLWMHDYSGGSPGAPDSGAFERTTRGYLRALLEAVRAYDRTGRMPLFVILLDQHYYDLRRARVWMDLLERPLSHRTRLPVPEMQRTIEALQDSLAAAVADSRRMQAHVAALGPDFPERVVKVHVNVTNPSDPTFRSRGLLASLFGGDNLMRDHRKVIVRDVTEADPAAGEVIVAGAGVGEHYGAANWEDRGVVVRGPAALAALEEARLVFEANGLGGERLPEPLRPAPFAADRAERVRRLEAEGATARVMQQHNRTGFGEKNATYLQMLLYDLAPAGTVIYVPNAIWTSWEWMAQLVAAALRGGHVYLVGTAAAHTPHGFPASSVTQELVTHAVLVRERFGDLIEAAGGELRLGLYARTAPVHDLPGRIAEAQAAFARHAFLGDAFPLDEDAWAVLSDFGGSAATAQDGGAAASPPGGGGEPVLLHRKTQLLASAAVLRALASDPGAAAVVAALLEEQRATSPAESGRLLHQRRIEPFLRLLDLHRSLPRDTRDEGILHLLVGSLNSDVRSMLLDGEVHVAVAGPWALLGWLDFLLLSGSVSWVETPEDVERLLPPASRPRRWLARFLEPVI